jgi:hypothetical protein
MLESSANPAEYHGSGFFWISCGEHMLAAALRDVRGADAARAFLKRLWPYEQWRGDGRVEARAGGGSKGGQEGRGGRGEGETHRRMGREMLAGASEGLRVGEGEAAERRGARAWSHVCVHCGSEPSPADLVDLIINPVYSRMQAHCSGHSSCEHLTISII